jgi:3-hydroxy-9,10-secoandrosta-1,3,5(10)-triene-9,17-dione monooxygenase reductase component
MTTHTATLDTRQLRRVLSEFTTGVAVVAAESAAGPVGMTVNSFTSVSLEPPMVLVCLANAASTTRAVTTSGAFGISILRRDQRGICDTFAATCPDKFAGMPRVTTQHGAPLIDDALAHLDCRVHQVLPAGDHLVVIGAVEDAATTGGGEPLTFFRGTLT